MPVLLLGDVLKKHRCLSQFDKSNHMISTRMLVATVHATGQSAATALARDDGLSEAAIGSAVLVARPDRHFRPRGA